MNTPRLCAGYFFIFLVSIASAPSARGMEINPQESSARFRRIGAVSREQIRWIKIRNTKNTFSLDAEMEQETRKLNASSSEADSSRTLLRESLEMNFEGSLYHPNFVDFYAALTGTPQQNKEKSGAASGRSGEFQNSYLSFYNIVSHFMQNKPLNFSLYADKKRDIHNYDFFERQTVDGINYGSRVNFRNRSSLLTMNFNRSREDVTRTFRSTLERVDERINLTAEPKEGPWGKLRIDLTRNKFDHKEAGASDQKGVNDNFNLLHSLFLDALKQKQLSSFLRYYSLEGNRDSRELSLNEKLAVEHKKNLHTRYSCDFTDRDAETTKTRRNHFSAGVTHQLYESLTSNADWTTLILDSTGFDEQSHAVSLSEDYVKRVGAGRVNVSLGLAYKNQNREAFDATVNIVDESLTLLDSQAVFLRETNIDTASIVITDSTGTIPYDQNQDYQVVDHLNGQVEIRRIVGGDIADGQTVLADYLVKSNPSFAFNTLENSQGIGVSFWEETLRLYTRRRGQSSTDTEHERSIILEAFNEMIYGMEFHQDIFTAGVEYQEYETDLSPFTSLRMHENLRLTGANAGFDINFLQNYVHLPQGDRENYEVRGKYHLRLSPSSVFGLEAGERWQKGSGLDLDDFTSRVNYRRFMGKIYFEIGYEYERETSLNDSLKDHYVYAKFKRDF